MPEPDSVILIPACVPAVIAMAGVNENVAVVATAFCGFASVMASPVMAPVMVAVSKATDCPASVLVLIWKPPVRIARALPRVSPVRVMVRAPVPVAAPPVVRTIVVLVAVAAGVEVAVTPPVVAMEETVPKK